MYVSSLSKKDASCKILCSRYFDVEIVHNKKINMCICFQNEKAERFYGAGKMVLKNINQKIEMRRSSQRK